MAIELELIRAQDVGGSHDGVAIEHQGAEHRAFRFQTVGGHVAAGRRRRPRAATDNSQAYAAISGVRHVFGLAGLSRAFHVLGQDNLHAILRRERATARPRSRNSFSRPRSPSRLRRRSWSKTLVPSAIRSWCSATTSLGAFSTNKRTASTVRATASISPKTGRRNGTSTTGFTINAMAAARASLLR